jgi:diguanylate cyclase (GGDEF)-like protein
VAAGPHDEGPTERFLVDAGTEKLRSHALLTLVDGARNAVDELGPDRGLPLVCARLLRAMDCTTAVLSLVDGAHDALVSVAGYDVSGVRTTVQGTRSLSADSVVSRVMTTQEPLFATSDPAASDADVATGPVIQTEGSWLALPLVLHGQSIGMLELLTGHREHRYSTGELVLAQGVCGVIAHTVAESRTFAAYRPGQGEPDGGGGPRNGNGRREVEQTLGEIARRLAEGLEVQHADVLIRDGTSGAVKVVARYDAGGEDASAAWKEYGLGDVGARAKAAAERCIVYAHDDDLDLPAEERAEMVVRGQRAVMYVPIVTGHEVDGFLCAIESRHSRRFTKADETFALQLADEAGVAVASARVVDRLQTQNQELRLLLETGVAIASTVDLRATLSTITERLVQTLGVAWSDIYDYHAETGELEVIAYYQVPGVPLDPQWIGQRFTRDTWPDGFAAVDERTPQTKYYDYSKLSFDDFAAMAEWGEKATLSVPLVYGDEVQGVLDLAESRYPRRFTADEMRLAQAIGNQAAVAIHNARLFGEATKRNQELATFLDVAETLSSTIDPKEVLSAIAERLRATLRCDSAEVYSYDPEARVIRLMAYASDTPIEGADEWSGIYDLADNPLLTSCIDDRRAMVVHLSDANLPEQTRADMERFGEACELWVPMVHKDAVLGIVLAAELSPDRDYTDDEIRLAVGIAAQAGVALENARAYERLEQERMALAKLNTRLSAFAELSGQMRGLLDEDELIDLLGRVMWEALEFNQWVVYIYDPESQFFNVAKAFGGTPEIDDHYANTPVPARVLYGLLSAARTISQSYFIDHLTHVWTDEENFYLPGEELVGERPEGEWNMFDSLFVPMMSHNGQLLGYIEAYDPKDRQRPTVDLVRMIEIFASKAASNIELRRTHRKLEEQSRTDGLTGLYNHRYFQERLTAEVARARRFGKPLTLLMIDVDGFKQFNDSFGHPEGDKVLKAFAGLLLSETRSDVDVVARYGGEEFVVLLPETGVGAATVAAERLQDQLAVGQRPAESVAEAIRMATEGQTFATSEGVAGRITVSVGIAAYPEQAATALELVTNADRALYMAKRLGKNRTCVYGR